jgi:hypothetical protein
MTTTLEMEAEVRQFADELFGQQPDWITFYREILGLHGIVRRMFPGREALAKFEQTETYQQIQRMLTRLRRQGPQAVVDDEPTRVITVRLPRSIHESLRAEAHDHHTSMNKLCISKLIQFIDNEKIPTDV